MMASRHGGLLIAANRLPVVVTRNADGTCRLVPGGGFVAALVPVLRNRGGTWVGWPGTGDPGVPLDALPAEAGHPTGCRLEAVTLTEEDERKFYPGFANEIMLCSGGSLSSCAPPLLRTCRTFRRRRIACRVPRIRLSSRSEHLRAPRFARGAR